jgi:hypothetical protein
MRPRLYRTAKPLTKAEGHRAEPGGANVLAGERATSRGRPT